MIELMGKMALCLIGALLLGFLIGWLFAKALRKEEKFIELDVEDDPEEIQAKLNQVEKLYEAEKAMSDEYAQRNKDLKEELMKKMSELDRKNTELREFERVLIKAEETIEAKEAYIRELISM